MANPYLLQRIKNPDLNLPMREAEVACLREQVWNLLAESNQLRLWKQTLESYLWRLSELVLAGEIEEAQEIARLSQKLLKDMEKEIKEEEG